MAAPVRVGAGVAAAGKGGGHPGGISGAGTARATGITSSGRDQGKETTLDGTVVVPAGTVEAPVLLMTWL
ncbi:hypothetical protein Sfulv_21690 [Streptomyces fulvorobeus]|uniref:Uncharacterized protein n=1 Tax=Streptomyces fulvorobeus TaxID=284028 RepID=A0A7J0C4M4_9ACTN|nr:hypothetical protein Sfulv_21690 [Streptomyces fulvorobeus]